ncbi:MAG: methylmalonyl-CoA mutase family protein [Balneolaceae bacterium]
MPNRGISAPSHKFRRGETRFQPVSDSSHINLTENLFGEFPPVPTEEWEAAIRKALNGGDYREELAWNSREGFAILPFYREPEVSSGESPPETGLRLQQDAVEAGCKIVEQIDGPTSLIAASQIETAIQRGSDYLQITSRLYPNDSSEPGRSSSPGLAGLDIQTLERFESMIRETDPKQTGFLFDSGVYTPALAAMQSASDRAGGADKQTLRNTFFTYDPYTFAAETGSLPMPEEPLEKLILQLANLPQKTLAGDGLFYHNCGATLSEELGIVLATGSEYLAAGRKAGANLNKLSRAIWIRLSAGPLYFPEIARFRAARILWRKLLDAYGVEPEEADTIHIHAVTSPWHQTTIDPYNNLIRTTTEAMAAIIGGADSLTVLPFDSHCATDSDRSRRLARNLHHIVREEAFLEQVADPAAGCWYIEELTDQIAENSWNFFREIESEGGLLQSLRNGTIQERVRKSAEHKINAVLTGTRMVTGVTYYSDPEEEFPSPSAPKRPYAPLRQSGRLFETDPDHLIQSLGNAYQEGASTGDLTMFLLDPPRKKFTTMTPSRLTAELEERWAESGKSFKPNPTGRRDG